MTKGVRKKSSKALRRKQMKYCNLIKVHRRQTSDASTSLTQIKKRRQAATVARQKMTRKTISNHSCSCNSTTGSLCRLDDGCEQRATLQYDNFAFFVISQNQRTANVFDVLHLQNNENVTIVPYAIKIFRRLLFEMHQMVKVKVCLLIEK